MIIIQVAGGLGNQLQQYALYKKFLSLSKEAKLDISWYTEDTFKNNKITTGRRLELEDFEGVSFEACTASEKKALVGGSDILGKCRRKFLPFTIKKFVESGIYHPEILKEDDLYISGYFACEKYYADILPKLREEIRFPKSKNPRNHYLARKMADRASVGVHIRRGDYLNSENAAMFGGICTPDYYKSAIDHIKNKLDNPHFYIFSDDVEYAGKEYQGEEFTVVDINHGADSFYDMWLMSQCKHNICANSTFSFWGARLNQSRDKIMIRPTIHKNSQQFVWEEMKELWEGWIFISPEGVLYEK